MKLTKRDIARAIRLADKGACALADAGRLFSLGGFEQLSRSMHTASFDAASALASWDAALHPDTKKE